MKAANELSKHLKTMAKRLNCRIVTVKRLRERGGKPVYGEVNTQDRVIYLAREAHGQTISLENRLFVLAHEIRHILHKKDGLYSSYYSSFFRLNAGALGVGMRAELDCDRWARE